jgi:hypothetical protein
MATNKDRIEKLELEIQEIKEGMQKMNTDSQVSFAEIKGLLSKSLDQGESFAVKDRGPFQGHGH